MPKVAINLESDIQPVTDFRANAASMLKQVRDTGRPLVLTQNGRGTAVLLDVSSGKSGGSDSGKSGGF